MSIPDILLIAPPFHDGYQGYRTQNIGVASLAAYLHEHGNSVTLLGAFARGLSTEETIERIMTLLPAHLLGFSVMYDGQYGQAVNIAKVLHCRGTTAHFTLGNAFATDWAMESLVQEPALDAVVRYEGEKPLLALTKTLVSDQDLSSLPNLVYRSNGRTRVNEIIPAHYELDDLPQPARDELPIILLVLDELEMLVHDYGANSVFFTDDNFLNGGGQRNRQRISDFVNGVRQRELKFKFMIECRVTDVKHDFMASLKSAGLNAVFLGVESIIPRVLHMFGKGYMPNGVHQALDILDELEIPYVIGYIMFDAYTTFKELCESVGFFRARQLYETYLNVLTIYRNSPLKQLYAAAGLLHRHDMSFSYDFKDPNVAKLVDWLQRRYIPSTRKLIRGIGDYSLIRFGWGNDDGKTYVFDRLAKDILHIDLDAMEQAMHLIETHRFKMTFP